MKRKLRTIAIALGIVTAMATSITSCTSSDFDETSDVVTTPSAPTNEYVESTMEWEGDITTFNGSGKGTATRATTSYTWKDGDKIFMAFDNNTTGYAVYSTTYKRWTIVYKNGLPASGSCTVYLFENAESANINEIKTNLSTAIYQSSGASYTLNNDVLSLTAQLTPICSKIRFRQVSGSDTIVIKTNCPSVNISSTSISVTYQSDVDTLTLTTASSGYYYSPYIYTQLGDSTKLYLGQDSMTFVRDLTISQLPHGGTGVITVPTAEYYDGWEIIDDELYGRYEAVDLGLPSGTLWATCNIGASKPEEYGYYFAWGETKPKTIYNSTTQLYTKNANLELSNDAANVNWGGNWRMPTSAEITELLNHCAWTWITINGVKGYKVSDNVTGNFIFLPAAGYRRDTTLDDAGSNGYYWSPSLYSGDSNYAYSLYFDSSSPCLYYYNYRYYGRPVRPVLPGSAKN